MPSMSCDVASAPVLQALRAHTAESHVALEKRLPFFVESLDSRAFLQLMQAYHGFYAPLEDALRTSPCFPSDFELQPRLKTAILAGDLRAMGLSDDTIGHLPRCQDLPSLDSAAACLGVLYVLEGATLGGQVLRRQIHARLGLDASSGAAFLDVYGADTGRRWRAFLDYLCTRPLNEAERAAAVAGAHATFRCFEDWLQSREVLL